MRVLLAVSLLVCACSESPFAPAPSGDGACGSDAWPCAFTCQLDCAQRALHASASCMLTLEGTLDSARTTCNFSDGSLVRFAAPVTSSSAQSWDLSIERGGQTCLHLRTDGLGGQTELSASSGVYRQILTVAGGDLGPRGLGQAQVRCEDGRLFAGPASSCYACAEGRGCQLDGVLQLQVTGTRPLVFTLQSGTALAPLFSCR
jgi:hypothetical protein